MRDASESPIFGQVMSPQEIIAEAQKLSLADQEVIATRLTYNLLGEMQGLGFQEA
jgi:hypothetical protein